MGDFIITYKIGKGDKERTLRISGNDRQDASINFVTEAPKEAYIVSIEEAPAIVPKKRIRSLKIMSSIDRFIDSQLKENNITNQELLKELHIPPNTWNKLRKRPENFLIYDLRLMASKFGLPLSAVIEEVMKVIKSREDNNELQPVRFLKGRKS